jgi:predicted phage terminase large subunit-like protein
VFGSVSTTLNKNSVSQILTSKTQNTGQAGASNAQIEKWRRLRWRGRTDLFFLAHNILGYNKKNYTFGIDAQVHGPLISSLQKFPMPEWETACKLDFVSPARCIYPYGGKPAMSRKALPGVRKRLILAPRSFFKCLCKSQRIKTLRGFVAVEDLVSGDQLWGLQDLEDYEASVVSLVAKEKQVNLQPCVELAFTQTSIRVSANHPIRTFTKSGPRWIPAGELRPGNRVVGLLDSVNCIMPEVVKEVSDIGLQETWDIQTSSGNFFLGDVLVKNTTLNCATHSIQWLLNYPDLAMLMVQSTTEKAELNLQEIKSHFIHNPTFREIYPDYCPQNVRRDFGNRTEFTLPNRVNKTRKEPTMLSASIDKKTAGIHVEVIKCSDIVEEGNTRTAGQMDTTAYAFEMFQKLLVDPDDFIDVEGTRYDFDDLYGRIIKNEKKAIASGYTPKWGFHCQGIYKKATEGEPTFQPDELDMPYLRVKDKFVSYWPERFSIDDLERERYNSPEAEEVFATQMLNNPLDVKGAQVFDIKEAAWIEPEDFAKAQIVHRTVTVDTAETQSARSDYTAITTCAWDRGGRCYVEDIRHGRMLQDEVVDAIFTVWLKYNPVSIKIEETAYVRGLKPTIQRMAEKLNHFPVFEWISRDSNASKIDRIKAIQPWYKSGDLRFLTNLKHRAELTEELARFPKSRYDDILDTIADQFQNKVTFGGRLSARKTPEEVFKSAQLSFIGLLDDDDDYGPEDPYLQRTGGL